MEDSGYIDDDFIEETARAYLARHGRAATAALRRLAETAEKTGDHLAAPTWRAIAEAAEAAIEVEDRFSEIWPRSRAPGGDPRG